MYTISRHLNNSDVAFFLYPLDVASPGLDGDGTTECSRSSGLSSMARSLCLRQGSPGNREARSARLRRSISTEAARKDRRCARPGKRRWTRATRPCMGTVQKSRSSANSRRSLRNTKRTRSCWARPPRGSSRRSSRGRVVHVCRVVHGRSSLDDLRDTYYLSLSLHFILFIFLPRLQSSIHAQLVHPPSAQCLFPIQGEVKGRQWYKYVQPAR